jgi:catechol 2,3-dioxygenase-like lactoylglutathione lyase family enzyme
MLSHVTLGSNDMSRARAFYDAVLATLGYQRLADFAEEGMGYGPRGSPEDRIPFWVLRPFNRERAGSGNGWHVAFLAPTRQAVRDFHAKALELGGRDEGAPGLRPDYHANYYGAYVRDLDGNKLQAVCHEAE